MLQEVTDEYDIGLYPDVPSRCWDHSYGKSSKIVDPLVIWGLLMIERNTSMRERGNLPRYPVIGSGPDCKSGVFGLTGFDSLTGQYSMA